MVNLYKELTSDAESIHAMGFKEKLRDMEVLKIFEGLYTVYSNEFLVKKIVLFIVYCYSKESDKIALGDDRRQKKGDLFRKMNFPHDNDEQEQFLYQAVVMLEETYVAEAAMGWLEKQNYPSFTHWITLKDAYAQMQNAIMLPIAMVDYDQKFRCVEYMNSLRKMIKEAEEMLMQNDVSLKPLYNEVKEKIPSRKNTIGPENFAHLTATKS